MRAQGIGPARTRDHKPVIHGADQARDRPSSGNRERDHAPVALHWLFAKRRRRGVRWRAYWCGRAQTVLESISEWSCADAVGHSGPPIHPRMQLLRCRRNGTKMAVAVQMLGNALVSAPQSPAVKAQPPQSSARGRYLAGFADDQKKLIRMELWSGLRHAGPPSGESRRAA